MCHMHWLIEEGCLYEMEELPELAKDLYLECYQLALKVESERFMQKALFGLARAAYRMNHFGTAADMLHQLISYHSMNDEMERVKVLKWRDKTLRKISLEAYSNNVTNLSFVFKVGMFVAFQSHDSLDDKNEVLNDIIDVKLEQELSGDKMSFGYNEPPGGMDGMDGELEEGQLEGQQHPKMQSLQQLPSVGASG